MADNIVSMAENYNRKVRKTVMPYITVESGALSDEQKEELIKRLDRKSVV